MEARGRTAGIASVQCGCRRTEPIQRRPPTPYCSSRKTTEAREARRLRPGPATLRTPEGSATAAATAALSAPAHAPCPARGPDCHPCPGLGLCLCLGLCPGLCLGLGLCLCLGLCPGLCLGLGLCLCSCRGLDQSPAARGTADRSSGGGRGYAKVRRPNSTFPTPRGNRRFPRHSPDADHAADGLVCFRSGEKAETSVANNRTLLTCAYRMRRCVVWDLVNTADGWA